MQATQPYEGFESYYAWLQEQYNRKRYPSLSQACTHTAGLLPLAFHRLRIDTHTLMMGIRYACRQLLISTIKAAGLKPYVPEGGFFIVADTSKAQVHHSPRQGRLRVLVCIPSLVLSASKPIHRCGLITSSRAMPCVGAREVPQGDHTGSPHHVSRLGVLQVRSINRSACCSCRVCSVKHGSSAKPTDLVLRTYDAFTWR